MGQYVDAWWPPVAGAQTRAERLGGSYRIYVPHPIAGWNPALPSAWVQRLAEAEDQCRITAARLESVPQSRLFFWAESLGSSRIEDIGPISPQRVGRARIALREGADVGFDDKAEQVLGNLEAVELVIGRLKDQLNLASFLDAHRTLMQADTPEFGGVIRREQNWIGGGEKTPFKAAFVPPNHEVVPKLLDDVLNYAAAVSHPSAIFQAATAHAQFEVIHPFLDGNGRIGRVLLLTVLCRRNCLQGIVPPVSLYLSKHKNDYIRALQSFQEYVGPPDDPYRVGGLEALVELLCAALIAACRCAERYADAVESLQEHWRMQLGGVRANSTSQRLLELLPAEPVITAQVAEHLTGSSRRRVDSAIARLVSSKVLTRRRLSGNAHCYEAHDIFEMFQLLDRHIDEPEVFDQALTDLNEKTRQGPDQRENMRAPLAYSSGISVALTSNAQKRCPKLVKSTGQKCELKEGHLGYCRSLPKGRAVDLG